MACGVAQAKTVFAYRFDYVTSLLGLLFQLYVLRAVWSSIYRGHDSVSGVNLSTMVTYATLASFQNWLLNPWQFSLIPDRVREGRVAVDLVRPVGFVTQVVVAQVGRTAATLPFGLLLVPALAILGARTPVSATAGFEYALSLVPAYAIITLLSVVVGMVSFWTIELNGMIVIYWMISQFLSGTMVPLWFMPSLLRDFAKILPFQAFSYTPNAIYVGQIGAADAIGAIAIQLVWVALLYVLCVLIWRRAIRRVVIQGG
ncbi:ABC transporter permease [Mangrovactinospora gilvigrisea]|nr:ABC-2 family transporter protein [Mangrovactinospora gilvigrisea]